MRRITLLTASLISILSLSACTQREIVKVDPLTQPIEKSEPTKPAEPILITVVPEAEVEDEDEDNNVEIDADIDYYGKEEVSQPAPSTPNTGFPAVSNPLEGVDYSQPSSFAQPSGSEYTDRFGYHHTGKTAENGTQPNTGGTW